MKFIYKLEKILKNICHTCSDYSFEPAERSNFSVFWESKHMVLFTNLESFSKQKEVAEI